MHKTKEELLKAKLEQISNIVSEEYEQEEHLGVLAGIGGQCLFQFYYSKLLDVDTYADIGVEMLFNCIDRINEGYNLPTYCTGLAGAGWVIDHLNQEDFIELDADDLLSNLDSFLHEVMMHDVHEGNYDYLHGAIGYGLYFLKRHTNTRSDDLKKNYERFLQDLVKGLLGKAEKDKDALRWRSVLNIETGEEGYNLSLSHGMASIINFLARLCGIKEFNGYVETPLQETIRYLLRFKSNDLSDFSLFPSWIKDGEEKDKIPSRVAWCYGDLGIGISLWKASKVLRDHHLRDTSLEILGHAAKRTSMEDSLVKDAGVCHGSHGNAQIFHKVYLGTGNPVFKSASENWVSQGLQMATHKDGYAGYMKWNGKDDQWERELSVLEGIAGIGLTIIDQLSVEPNSWDECLMIQ